MLANLHPDSSSFLSPSASILLKRYDSTLGRKEQSSTSPGSASQAMPSMVIPRLLMFASSEKCSVAKLVGFVKSSWPSAVLQERINYYGLLTLVQAPVAFTVRMDPCLPPELEREIFESTAQLHPKSIPILLLVARRIFEWIQPFLYRTIMVAPSSRSMAAFLRVTRTTPPNSSFFRNSVQNLFVHQTSWLVNEARFILSSCSGIMNFAMMATNPSVLPLLENKRLKRLSISLAQLFDNGLILHNLTHSIFTHTTHLTLFDFTHNDQHWATLASLPELTHLCLHSFVRRSQLLGVLADCKGLQVLVNMHINTEPEWGLADICARLAIHDDPRFVLFTLDVSTHAFSRDWERGHSGGKDFWAVADAFVGKKRMGEIKPASRCWICDLDGVY
ncbi:hypothetical protein C8R45DRAFT_932281 [Mycena sanguinolenta]|nr:hypothetical protein C8R45DRAFT_932281 [Mycena sanguinolenta]